MAETENISGVIRDPVASPHRQRGRPRGAASVDGAVQSLDRALTLLDVLAAGDGIALSDLAKRAGLAPSSAYRLLQTLAAWLATGGSAGRTAAHLYCHRNTVLNRLRRVEALSGRSTERVDDLVAWSLALLARDLLPGSAPSLDGSARLDG